MNYENLMNKCIQLARIGEGNVSPNPLVGCVVLDKNDNIISVGYHHKCGDNHAERDALLKISDNSADGGTLFVNLEPCSHFGKTPPCADLIIEKKIKKVVIGTRDVNPIVAGNGINKLKAAGIVVIEGVLEKKCKKLNEIFFKNMISKKTFVAIKSASTIDGKIATYSGSSKWITSQNAREEVLNIRNRYDAILTSSSTVIADNPTMLHKNKIILDRTLSTDFINSNIYKSGNILVYYNEYLSSSKVTEIKNSISENISLVPAPVASDKIDLNYMFKDLYNRGIKSVLTEAGGKLAGSVLPFADKIYQFIAPKIIGDNSARSSYDFRKLQDISEAANFIIDDVRFFPPDVLLTLYPKI